MKTTKELLTVVWIILPAVKGKFFLKIAFQIFLLVESSCFVEKQFIICCRNDPSESQFGIVRHQTGTQEAVSFSPTIDTKPVR